MMHQSDFHNITTLQDIEARKAALRRQIASHEVKLKNEVANVKQSFSVLSFVGRSVSYLTGFSRKRTPLGLFALGYKLTKALFSWRKR